MPARPLPPPSPLRRHLRWLDGYDRRTARADTLAGTTLAAYAIPSSIAYAQLAGMPVQTGLYCYLFAGLAYALLGTSRQLAVGPTSSVALILATTLGGIAAADAAHYAGMAATTALLVGLIALGAWALRWGAIVHFISETVLTGFKIGAGIVIAASQLPLLLGIANGRHDFARSLMHVLRNLPSLHMPSLILGVTAYALLQGGQAYRPRWPVSLLVVIAALLLMEWPATFDAGIATVGAIPQGLPAIAFPVVDWRELDTLLPLALACFLLAYNEGIAAARLLAARHDHAIDPNRELLGLAGANIAIAVGQGFPSGGGLSQSLVNDQAGARSPVSIVICSAWMAVALLYLTGLFNRLPQPLLAALVIASVQGMFKIDEMRQLRRASMQEFVIAMVTIAAVLSLGILKGVLVAAIFSLALLIRRLAQPEFVLLGRLPGTDHFVSLVRHPDARPTPGVLVFRPNAALLYFNADSVREHMIALLERAPRPLRQAILDLSFTTELDLSSVRMLADLARKARADGVELRLADAHYRVRALLVNEGHRDLFGDLSRAYSVADLVAQGPLVVPAANPAGVVPL